MIIEGTNSLKSVKNHWSESLHWQYWAMMWSDDHQRYREENSAPFLRPKMQCCEKRWTDVKMDRTGYATRRQHPRGHSSSCLISSCDTSWYLSHFLQFWCSSVNHEAKCVHLQPPWSFWWHLAHIWKLGLILDFMSLMTPALVTIL